MCLDILLISKAYILQCSLAGTSILSRESVIVFVLYRMNVRLRQLDYVLTFNCTT